MKAKVLIIGAGCAGWWVTSMLALHRISTVIVDTNPVAAYASTRNQGWLHSGAYYATRDDTQTFQDCKNGFDFINHYFPQAILANIPCYYLFRTSEEREKAVNRCTQAGIFARTVDFNQLLQREPILAPTRFVYPLEVSDRPINTSLLMQQVVQQACDQGARFQAVRNLDSIKPVWDANKGVWRVLLDEKTRIECKIIVVACGAYIPAMLKRLLPGEIPAFTIMKTPVLVLQGEVAHSMLITPGVFQGPNLVPFSESNGSGVAITLQHLEERVEDHTDFALPADCMQIFKEGLLDTFGGLHTLVEQKQFIPAHFYICQKLFRGDIDDIGALDASRSGCLLTHAPEPGAPENVLTVYPGKLTAAPIVAQQCVKRLLPLLEGSKRSGKALLKKPAPLVAQRHLCADHTHKLTMDVEQLDFIAWNKDSMEKHN